MENLYRKQRSQWLIYLTVFSLYEGFIFCSHSTKQPTNALLPALALQGHISLFPPQVRFHHQEKTNFKASSITGTPKYWNGTAFDFAMKKILELIRYEAERDFLSVIRFCIMSDKTNSWYPVFSLKSKHKNTSRTSIASTRSLRLS